MKERNRLREILEKKSRSSGRYLPGRSELQDLDWMLECHGDSSIVNSLTMVGLAGCIEVSVRNAIERLIDHGAPYVDRLDQFKKCLEFDLQLTKALSDGEITFGNLVAHLLPVSNLSHIASHLEKLLNGDGHSKSLARWLSDIQPFVEPDDDYLSSEDLQDERGRRGMSFESFAMRPVRFPISNVPAVLADIEKIFVVRHIVAHEADFSNVTLQQIDVLLGSATVFATALQELVEQVLHPGEPRSVVRTTVRDARKIQRFYATILDRENEAMRALAARGQSAFSAIGHFQKASRAFSDHVEAEVRFTMQANPIQDRCNRRSLDTSVRKSFYDHRYTYLSGEIDALTSMNDFLFDCSKWR
ncbi:hypothetical protein [Caballeronia sp. ATUFL_M2_KS44]|uniref:hypothetical protein n=1 Tax=Caballeronia sp. ATUFL_M2_KS44 TaxID=2921767 RepID=UPI00202936A6|nr:hypothetical protein [Caballeronia sp. ATUFL_M2_KS44]